MQGHYPPPPPHGLPPIVFYPAPPPPPDRAARQPPAPRGKWLEQRLCWAVLLAAVVAMAWPELIVSKPAKSEKSPDPAVTQSVGVKMMGRISLGAASIFPQGSGSDQAEMRSNVRGSATNSVDRIRVIMVIGEMGAPAEAQSELRADAPELNKAGLGDDAASLRVIYGRGPDRLNAAQRSELIRRHGWFGELALTHGLPANDPRRQAALFPARRAILAMLAVLVGALGFSAIGLGLLIWALVRVIDHRFVRAYGRPMRNPTPYLFAFTIYLAGFAGFDVGMYLLFRWMHWGPIPLGATWMMGLIIAAALAWPMLRGERFSDLRQALGWHAGKGVAVEMFWGVAGYVAGLPLLIVCFIATALLNKLAKGEGPPGHPIMGFMQSPWQIAAVLALACVWAPLTEETMFRGAFYHYWRGRWGWLISSLGVAVIFAIIHPQGWTFLPVLGAIAVTMATLREWRGSLIASMTAHGLNNFIVTVMAVCVLY